MDKLTIEKRDDGTLWLEIDSHPAGGIATPEMAERMTGQFIGTIPPSMPEGQNTGEPAEPQSA